MTTAATTLSPIEAATMGASKGALVVSVHDVAPSTRETVEKILADLARCGISRCSLLVVPNYHHHGLATEDRECALALREWSNHGHEIVIHGYFHERPVRPGEKARTKMVTRIYTRGEGEFYDLSYDEALARISRAKDEFAAAGLKPNGFIAPAWLLNTDGEAAATDAEMEYTTRIGSVRDLRQRRTFTSQSLVYSASSPWRRATSLGWNALLFQALRQRPLVRLGIHPPDYEHPEIWQQIRRFAERLARGRTVTTYGDWVAEQRLQGDNL